MKLWEVKYFLWGIPIFFIKLLYLPFHLIFHFFFWVGWNSEWVRKRLERT